MVWWNALCDLAVLGHSEVVREPIVCDENKVSLALIADLGSEGSLDSTSRGLV